MSFIFYTLLFSFSFCQSSLSENISEPEKQSVNEITASKTDESVDKPSRPKVSIELPDGKIVEVDKKNLEKANKLLKSLFKDIPDSPDARFLVAQKIAKRIGKKEFQAKNKKIKKLLNYVYNVFKPYSASFSKYPMLYDFYFQLPENKKAYYKKYLNFEYDESFFEGSELYGKLFKKDFKIYDFPLIFNLACVVYYKDTAKAIVLDFLGKIPEYANSKLGEAEGLLDTLSNTYLHDLPKFKETLKDLTSNFPLLGNKIQKVLQKYGINIKPEDYDFESKAFLEEERLRIDRLNGIHGAFDLSFGRRKAKTFADYIDVLKNTLEKEVQKGVVDNIQHFKDDYVNMKSFSLKFVEDSWSVLNAGALIALNSDLDAINDMFSNVFKPYGVKFKKFSSLPSAEDEKVHDHMSKGALMVSSKLMESIFNGVVEVLEKMKYLYLKQF